jgi:hypothetical protein
VHVKAIQTSARWQACKGQPYFDLRASAEVLQACRAILEAPAGSMISARMKSLLLSRRTKSAITDLLKILPPSFPHLPRPIPNPRLFTVHTDPRMISTYTPLATTGARVLRNPSAGRDASRAKTYPQHPSPASARPRKPSNLPSTSISTSTCVSSGARASALPTGFCPASRARYDSR